MSGRDEQMREEFLAEAQEIVEALARDLLSLDQAQKEGRTDPDLINEIFRGVHTLKGISHMFAHHKVGALAHALEDLLDDLRLGRVDLSQHVLDVLFEGVENFQRLLGESSQGKKEEDVDLAGYAESIERVVAPRDGPVNPGDLYEIDQSVLSVLTEYEEHRLRTNVEQGVPLFRLKVRFSLTSIDSSLEELKAQTKPLGEIITCLPSLNDSLGDAIELDVLLATRASMERVQEAVGPEVVVAPIARRAPRIDTDVPPAAPAPLPRPPRAVSDASRPPLRGSEPAAPPGEPRGTVPPRGAALSEYPVAGVERPEREGGDVSLRSVAHTVRVDIRKLDHLMNVVSELALVRSTVARIHERIRGRPDLRPFATDLHRANRGFERHLSELQDGILAVRMVPLRQVFDRLARVVRQVARDHEKEVRLVVTGADTEVDKLIVEELSDPLMHIIRNAIDHGIEKPKVRELSGKPTVGTLALNAYQKGNHVLIEVEDDGSGIDPEAIVDAAIGKNLVPPESRVELTRQEKLDLVFLPGFTSRSTISDTSGRGVGLDVVKTNIGRLGGVVDVASEARTGTKFTITLPITLAIMSALVVRVAGRTFCVPLSTVQEALALDARAIRTVEGREVLTLRGATLPLCRLDRLFRLAPPPDLERPRRSFVVVTSLGQRRLGFVVDDLSGQQDIVIKSLGASLSGVRGFAGATDLGDQRVALVLDAPTLLEEVLTSGADHGRRGDDRPRVLGSRGSA